MKAVISLCISTNFNFLQEHYSCFSQIVMASSISSDVADSFKYQPIDSSAQEIRLLWVRPASSPYDLIECSLHVTKLNRGTKYVVCESGEIDQSLEYVILCDDQLCQVSQDVYSRLLRLRGLDWQWIWWESVCVNQRDTRERVEQISMKPTIFKQAERCFRLVSRRQQELSTPTERVQGRPIQPVTADRPYEHSPLTGSDQIRLMELLPAETIMVPLRCQFNVVSLDNTPKFTWIDVNFPIPNELPQSETFLYCNERPLPTHPVLNLALQALRSSGQTTFWIESVCVNENDPADRLHHAALGEMILRKAHQRMRVQRQLFHYAKLDSAQNQIRLLRIRPVTSANSELVIELITASLDEKPDYVALSYAWGSNNRDYDVKCVDGSTISVTASLHMTLWELRQKCFTVVWADQICINQLDRQELGQQVSIMSRIYSQARSVVVRLGTIPGCQNLETHLCHLIPQPPKQPDWLVLMRILSLTRSVLLAVRPDKSSVGLSEFERFGLPPLKHKVWSSWRAVRADPWFTRGWIIQEVAANANVWVLCCRRLVKWEDLVAANYAIEGEVAVQGSISGQKFFVDLEQLKGSTGISNFPLIDLVSAFRDVQTSDVRDKIYAFRGLAGDADIAPCPDYTRPAPQIYHEFAKYCVNQGQGMSLICEAGLNKTSMDNPSWVADWSFDNSSLYNCARGRDGSMKGTLSMVYEHRETLNSSDVTLTSDPSVISVTGIMGDTISGVSEGFKSGETIQDELESFCMLDTTALALPVFLERHTSIYEELLTVFARTLFVGSKDYVEFYQEVKAQAHDFEEETGLDPLGFGYRTYLRGRLLHLNMRRFAVTEKGYMGLVPTLAEKGDKIVAFKGCRAPFVLRKKENMYVIIGDAHFDGLERPRLYAKDAEKLLLR